MGDSDSTYDSHDSDDFKPPVKRKIGIRNIKQWKCAACPAVLRHVNILKGHIFCYHPEIKSMIVNETTVIPKRYLRKGWKDIHRCPHCKASFATKNGLGSHIGRVHPTREPTHHCQACDQKFRSVTGLRNHINKMHPDYFRSHLEDVKSEKLPIVNRDGKSSSFLVREEGETSNSLKKNTPISAEQSLQSKFYCPFCPLKCSNFVCLFQHVKAFHTNITNTTNKEWIRLKSSNDQRKGKNGVLQMCPSCKKTFKDFNGLKIHICKRHRNEIVNDEFGYPLNPIRKFNQTPQKPYIWACTICEASYQNKYSLRDHLFRRHPTVNFIQVNGQSVFSKQKQKPKQALTSISNPENDIGNSQEEACVKIIHFQCPYCPTQFLNETQFQNHLTISHHDRPPFIQHSKTYVPGKVVVRLNRNNKATHRAFLETKSYNKHDSSMVSEPVSNDQRPPNIPFRELRRRERLYNKNIMHESKLKNLDMKCLAVDKSVMFACTPPCTFNSENKTAYFIHMKMFHGDLLKKELQQIPGKSIVKQEPHL